MSWRIMAEVFDTDLPATEKFVLLTIANFVNETTGYAWPSQDTIARKASLTRQTVNKAIKSLVRKNYLVSLRRSDKGKSTSNIYQINRVALFDSQQHHVAENDNEVSNSSAEVCKGGAALLFAHQDRHGIRAETRGTRLPGVLLTKCF